MFPSILYQSIDNRISYGIRRGNSVFDKKKSQESYWDKEKESRFRSKVKVFLKRFPVVSSHRVSRGFDVFWTYEVEGPLRVGVEVLLVSTMPNSNNRGSFLFKGIRLKRK